FSLCSSALFCGCAHDQQESARAVSRMASVFLIVPASCTRSCTSRICVGCDRLSEGGLAKALVEGCWRELRKRSLERLPPTARTQPRRLKADPSTALGISAAGSDAR